MEIRNLVTFLKVTELQNFSKAAEALDYSQSAVTVQIQQLERELGVKLFDRIGKNVTITQYGRDFISYARDVVAAVSRAGSFATKKTELAGQVTVGAIESLLTTTFKDLLPAFHREFPGVNTRVYVGSVADIGERLSKNELDVIYTLDEQTVNPLYVRLFEKEESIVVVANKAHPLTARAELTLEDIVGEQFVLLDKNTRYRQLFDTELARKNLSVRPFLEMDSVVMVLRLLSENADYLTVVPRYAAQRSIHKNDLAILPVTDCNMRQWRQILYHKSKVITPQIQGMIDVMLRFAKEPL
ncbi:MAG: LysR family transcriptional regulator [Oscillospiraceae bacterium]|nr:LysR family transcriptional regulator [Oscillospiraceae bacterium]